MWISEVPIVVANRQAGRILCSIDLLSHAVRSIAVMCLLQCRYKKSPPTTSYTIVNFSQEIFIYLMQHWMEFVHGKLQKAVNIPARQRSITSSTKSEE